MMYKIYCDGQEVDISIEEVVTINPKLILEENNAGSLEFTIAYNHPMYDKIIPFVSEIVVKEYDSEIWSGRVSEVKVLMNKNKVFYCEGELAYLNDSIQPQAEYHDISVRGFLQALITIHNNKMTDSSKQFRIGSVTVTDPNNSLYRYTNRESTMECINEKLIKRLGGHLRIRKLNGYRYLDYLEDYPVTNTQVIKFGENLLDYSSNVDVTDIATVIVPLGARLDVESDIPALDQYLTIASVNDGKEYLASEQGVNTYGWIEKVVQWDDVHVPEILLSKAVKWLSDEQFDDIVLTLKAVDMHLMDEDIQGIHLLDKIRAISEPHGMDKYFPVTKLEIPFKKPSETIITLGSKVKVSLTAKNSSDIATLNDKINEIPTKYEILEEAKQNATDLINSATHGHVVTTAEEILIMDTDDTETATKVWRWNLNGLGYSGSGYNGTFGTAITMDGGIVGDYLVAGSVSAQKLDANYRSEVERQIELAESNANDHTDEELKKYWVRSEIETQIKNTADSVLISAKETATAYTDDKLKNYSTSAQIKVTTDAISSEVAKKVNSTEIISKINQTAETVKIQASKIKLEGLVTANNNFKILADGSIEAKNGTFTGNITGSTLTFGTTKKIKAYPAKYSDGTEGVLFGGKDADFSVSSYSIGLNADGGGNVQIKSASGNVNVYASSGKIQLNGNEVSLAKVTGLGFSSSANIFISINGSGYFNWQFKGVNTFDGRAIVLCHPY